MMSGGNEHDGDRRRQGLLEWSDRVRGDPGEQRARLVLVPAAREQCGRPHRAQPEPSELDRVPRDVQHGPKRVLGDVVQSPDDGSEQPTPRGTVGTEPRDGGVERADHHADAPSVERVGEIDLRPAPPEPVAFEVG